MRITIKFKSIITKPVWQLFWEVFNMIHIFHEIQSWHNKHLPFAPTRAEELSPASQENDKKMPYSMDFVDFALRLSFYEQPWREQSQGHRLQ